MKADVVFIGGGLAALVAGIKLLKAGKSVIIVSAGQSALHFSSGSLCVLNQVDGTKVNRPLDYIDTLVEEHPYRKVGGAASVGELMNEAVQLLKESGIELKGSTGINHYRLSPFGVFTPASYTLTDHFTLDDINRHSYRRAAIIGIDGFLDFYPEFISKGLAKIGIDSLISSVNISEFNLLRNNPTEMRAPNIARALTDEGLERYAQAINRNIGTCDLAIIPAVVGLNDTGQVNRLRELVNSDIYSVSTIPVAVPGIRMKILLQQYFTELGGWYLLGDSVTDGSFNCGMLEFINTANLGSTKVTAAHYVLSTGGLFSRGLKSDSSRMFEPVFGLDVYADADRALWYDKNFFKPQPFMRYGVETDNSFHCLLNGGIVNNLYAIGGVLGGPFDPLSDGVGAGVALTSALFVAEKIIKGGN